MKTNNLIYTQIRHISLRLFSFTLIALALFMLIVIQIPFDEIFQPFPLSYVNAANTVYDTGTDYVELTLDDVTYTGYDCTRRGKRYGSYYYSLVNNACTFVVVDTSAMNEIPATLTDYKITARLVSHDAMLDEVLEAFAEDIGWTYEGLKSVTFPVIVDETEYNILFFRYLVFICTVILICIITMLMMQIIYFIFPWLYPACINFRRISQAHKGVARVNRELQDNVIHQFGNITLTEHFLVAFNSFHLEIVPIKKIIWVYSHSRWHRILWLKSRLSYSLYITCQKHIRIYSPGNTKEDIDAVIEYFNTKYPDILIGYSKEHRRLAKKKA